MAYSAHQRKAIMDAVNAKKPAALKRDSTTDYSSGYFFVTLNVRNHIPLLGSITGCFDPSTRTADHVKIELSPLGEKVQNIWNHLPLYYPNVRIIDCAIMPEHLHGLLHLDLKDGVSLGFVIKGFKIGCNRTFKQIYHLDTASLFSSGYNETIPITPEDVEIKKEYIRDNPHRRFIKNQLTDSFTIFRQQHSAHWTLPRIVQGLQHDLFLARHPDALQTAITTLLPHLIVDNQGRYSLDYIGPRSLLWSPLKVSLICHRADDNRICEQSEAVIRAARSGAVIVSAFISKQERDILQQLIAIHAPVIQIMDNGFSTTYKPWGVSFYACAENRLLQITPWTYRYEKNSAPLSRPQCMLMNELVRLISNVEDDWWKYPEQ